MANKIIVKKLEIINCVPGEGNEQRCEVRMVGDKNQVLGNGFLSFSLNSEINTSNAASNRRCKKNDPMCNIQLPKIKF